MEDLCNSESLLQKAESEVVARTEWRRTESVCVFLNF